MNTTKKATNRDNDTMFKFGNLRTNIEILAENLKHLAEGMERGGRPLAPWEIDLSIMASKQAMEAMLEDMPQTGGDDKREFFERMHATVEDLSVLTGMK